jgi:hypothetical protein
VSAPTTVESLGIPTLPVPPRENAERMGEMRNFLARKEHVGGGARRSEILLL